jgi:phosphatidylglycerophosphate synthase
MPCNSLVFPKSVGNKVLVECGQSGNMEQKATALKDIGTLLFRSGIAARIINLITLYRIVTFPILVYLVGANKMEVFQWLLLASFLTDAIDGFLARQYNVTSILGSKLDSIGDDLTVLAATLGLFVTRFDFIKQEAVVFIALFMLFVIQVGLSFHRYGKMSTFHTYLAKIAAVVTAVFLLSVFFLETINYSLFYVAAAITAIELIEEIILVRVIRKYQSNVKGLYWVMQSRRPD